MPLTHAICQNTQSEPQLSLHLQRRCLESVLAVALLHHHAGHALDAVGPVVLVVGLARHVLQVLHVRADEHVPQLHEVAVRRVLHCKSTARGIRFGSRTKGEEVNLRVGRRRRRRKRLTHPRRYPRGTGVLAPSSLWPPPLCCCR